MKNDFLGFSHSDCNGDGSACSTGSGHPGGEQKADPTQVEKMIAVIQEVDAIFPDDASLMKFLLQLLMEEGLCPSACQCSNPCFEFINARQIECINCNVRCWLTAETLLAYKKRPKAWFTAIVLKENHIVVGSPTLGKYLVVSPSTAWKMTQTLRLVVSEEVNDNELLISSRRLIDVFNRRSRLTPAGQHPSSEQSELDLKKPHQEDIEAASKSVAGPAPEPAPETAESAVEGTPLRVQLLNLFSTEKISLDAMCEELKFSVGEILGALTELELDGLIVSHFGNYFAKVAEPGDAASGEILGAFSTEALNATVQMAMKLIGDISGGVSRKFVQLALQELWMLQDHERWPKYSLLRLCLKHPPIHAADIRNYVSPAIVRLNVAFCTAALS